MMHFILTLIALVLPVQCLATEISITMDDFDVTDSSMFSAEEKNRRILNVFKKHSNLKTTLFVRGMYVDSKRGQKLLKEWDQESHQIANHTYSHKSYGLPEVSFPEFSQDVLKAEKLIQKFVHFDRLFRFPYLQEGNTSEKRDQMREFLKKKGYQMGYVTIDASDWYVNDRMMARFKKNEQADLRPYRDYYLNHLWDRAVFYNDLSKKVLGREVKHTLLVHYNQINALFLDDVIHLFKKKGWKVISSREAFKDPVFQMASKVIPAGNSILWGLAKETGRFESLLRDPGEDGEYEKEPMDRLGL
jgi:peptidoglycan/xylan/chitin deacetylase (PgdA/CDA1 family)